MRSRKFTVVVIVVAVVGFLAYMALSRANSDEDATNVTMPTTTSAPTTTAAAPPPEIGITEAPAASPAEEAARQGLTVAFTWYPATDATQNDAYARARNWLSDKLADRMMVDATTERGPSVQWSQWAQDQAKVIADVTIGCSGCPEDTDTVVHRVATIRQTAIAGNSTDTVKPDTTVWVTIVREGDRWLIDDIRY